MIFFYHFLGTLPMHPIRGWFIIVGLLCLAAYIFEFVLRPPKRYWGSNSEYLLDATGKPPKRKPQAPLSSNFALGIGISVVIMTCTMLSPWVITWAIANSSHEDFKAVLHLFLFGAGAG